MLTWEWNFNLGTIASLIFAAGIFYAITKSDLKGLKDNIVDIKSALAKQSETIQQIAVQKSILESQARDIDRLTNEVREMRPSRDYIRRIEGEWPKS